MASAPSSPSWEEIDPSLLLTAPLSPDAEMLARAQAGDHHAFAHLYSLHKRRIYSLCLRMVGNVAEAEDLTQEAFLQSHRKSAPFAATPLSPPGSIGSPSTSS